MADPEVAGTIDCASVWPQLTEATANRVQASLPEDGYPSCNRTDLAYNACKTTGKGDAFCMKQACEQSGDCTIVQSGDTLQRIAQRFGQSVCQLLFANDMQAPRPLKPGAPLLLIPRAEFQAQDSRCNIPIRHPFPRPTDHAGKANRKP